MIKNAKVIIFIVFIIVGTCLSVSFPSFNNCFLQAFTKPEEIYQVDRIQNYSIDNSILTEKEISIDEPSISLVSRNKTLQIIKLEIPNLSMIRKQIYGSNFNSRVKVMNFAYSNGFSYEQSVCYAFPEVEYYISEIETKNCYEPCDANIEVIPNSANIKVNNEKSGVKIDKNVFYYQIFNKFNNFKNSYIINIPYKKVDANVKTEDLKDRVFLRGSHKTYFGSSTDERKNNIRIALKSLDGQVLNPGEVLSFNNTTGYRTQENGYQKAKIIKEGTFINEYGGGVCQVSTTLYNSALLAGLEVVEVNGHSIPIAYEMPCFDAMVNSGSSDLKIKNNTEFPVYIATSSENDFCKINVYGVKNNYKIVRKSKKIKEIEHFDQILTDDYKKFGFENPLAEGESKVISYGKNGYVCEGLLEYYSGDVLVKTEKIRKNTYNPTKEVILVSSLEEKREDCGLDVQVKKS